MTPSMTIPQPTKPREQLIQTLSINEGEDNSVVSLVLIKGKNYRFEVSGQRRLSFSTTEEFVDARFVTRDGFKGYSDAAISYPRWAKNKGDYGLFASTPYGGGWSDDLWGDYNNNHTYSFKYTGEGASVHFMINDENSSLYYNWWPGINDSTFGKFDNTLLGTFTIRIFEELGSNNIPFTGLVGDIIKLDLSSKNNRLPVKLIREALANTPSYTQKRLNCSI